MPGLTRNQEYIYQYLTVAAAQLFFCGFGPRLSVNVPKNLLEIKSLCVHAILLFDATVPASYRKLYYIGGEAIINTYPLTGLATDQLAMIYVNRSADANRRIDITVDISHLIDKLIIDDGDSYSSAHFDLGLVTDLGNNNVGGTLELWKVDMIYTTKGIQ